MHSGLRTQRSPERHIPAHPDYPDRSIQGSEPLPAPYKQIGCQPRLEVHKPVSRLRSPLAIEQSLDADEGARGRSASRSPGQPRTQPTTWLAVPGLIRKKRHSASAEANHTANHADKLRDWSQFPTQADVQTLKAPPSASHSHPQRSYRCTSRARLQNGRCSAGRRPWVPSPIVPRRRTAGFPPPRQSGCG